MWPLYALIETEDANCRMICRVHERPTACRDDDLGSKLAAKLYAKVS